jgi:3-methyladenine DNA glycosylase AlkD
MNAKSLITELNNNEDPIRANHSQRFFKTGKGEYGEGDVFIGLTMPGLRKICKDYRDLSINDLQVLLSSPIHEHRMSAVVIMADIFKNSKPEKQKQLYDLYIKAVKNNQINNWDLIDVSAPHVVGGYFVNTSAEPMYKLAKSNHLWSKRTSVLSTGAYLKIGDSSHTYKVAEILLHDPHDLIQKAVGWFLREAGKRVSEQELLDFLNSHAHEIPRTMLRYSIEKLSPQQREYYMKLKN